LINIFLAVLPAHGDLIGRDLFHNARCTGNDDHARVPRGLVFDTGPDDGRLGPDERYGLALHVRSHQRPVGVVVFKERDHRRSHRNKLLRRNVHVIDAFSLDLDYVVLVPAQYLPVYEPVFSIERFVCLGDDELVFLVRSEVMDLVGDDSRGLVDLPVRSLDEPVLIDPRICAERADKTDVGTFRRLYRAHTAVMGMVHVTDFEARPFPAETSGSQCTEPSLVGQLSQRVRLVHELGQLAAAEELLDGCDYRPYVYQRLW